MKYIRHTFLSSYRYLMLVNTSLIIQKKSFLVFLKDFDICPTLVGKSFAYNIFNIELNSPLELNEKYKKIQDSLSLKFYSKNYFGQYFNFFKFIRSLIRLADSSFESLELGLGKKISSFEKFCLLLEKMELSIGFQRLMEKSLKTNTKKNSILITKEILEKVNTQIYEKKEEEEKANASQDNEIQLTGFKNTFSKFQGKVKDSIYNNIEHYNYITEKYGKDLFIIFKYYCSFGDAMNTEYLKASNFTKLYKEANLIYNNNQNNSEYGIKFNDFDVIMVKIVGADNNSNHIKKNNNAVKIDFQIFINSIEVISKIIFENHVQIQEKIDMIVEKNLLPLSKNIKNNYKNQINFDIMKKKEETEIKNLSNLIQKSFSHIFKFYTKRNDLLDFDSFFKFCKDFDIFPSTISKSRLNYIFKHLNPISLMTDKSKGGEKIDLQLFSDIILIISTELRFNNPQPNEVERILSLIERLSESDGAKKNPTR